ncbi:MAG: hypothetical protein O3A85_08575 [Proteobacteria bacterium]|nr:hypothetical protein [Pseudomonadota bacterium]
MNDIAPLNYERWAVVVSPLLVPEAQEVKSAFGSRQTEQLVQVGASLGRLDTRKKESLIEQSLRQPEQRSRIPGFKPPRSPPPTTSHPSEWLLRQPLPMAAIASARNQSAPALRTILKLYTPPALPVVHRVRLDG